MSGSQRFALGIRRWNPAEAYDRVEYLFVKLCRLLETGFDAPVEGRRERVDAHWFANRIAKAAVCGTPLSSSSLAVDGTDVETWGALRGDASTLESDGDADDLPP